MPLTITVSDELATLLQAQAQMQSIPVEQWALTVLGQAAQHPGEMQTWASLNQRRFALLNKRFATGLDATEERDLEFLQKRVAELLAPWDSDLHAYLAPFENLTARLAA